MKMPLGTLQFLDPRDVWTHEALDFTPWLAQNIDGLGRALGLELEVEEREADVGSFSVDLLVRDLGRDRRVIVENQLEATDHGHLGQLITYAAGLDAEVVVWISREFREEHRQALDWLNQLEGSSVEFFGVVLELLRVDASPPAVNFRLASAPNNWSRASKKAASAEEASPRRGAYQQFFQRLIDDLREKHQFTNAKAGQPQNWYSFSSGVRGFQYSMSFAASGELRSEIYIDTGDRGRNESIFKLLAARKDEIETQYGEPLKWESLEGKRACRIACYAPGSIDDDKADTHRAWAIDHLLRFKKVFGPFLPTLA